MHFFPYVKRRNVQFGFVCEIRRAIIYPQKYESYSFPVLKLFYTKSGYNDSIQEKYKKTNDEKRYMVLCIICQNHG